MKFTPKIRSLKELNDTVSMHSMTCANSVFSKLLQPALTCLTILASIKLYFSVDVEVSTIYYLHLLGCVIIYCSGQIIQLSYIFSTWDAATA